MTIGMVVDNEFYGDPRVFNEAKALVQAGYRTKILCLNFGKHPPRETVQGIELVRAAMKRKTKQRLFALMNTLPLYHRFWKRQTLAFIRSEGIDVLHAHDLYMALSAGKAAREAGIPLVLDLHENYPAAVMGYNWAVRFPARLVVRPERWAKLEPHCLKLADRIVVLSAGFRDLLVKRYAFLRAGQFAVYPNVPDLKELLGYPVDPAILPEQGRFVMFYFGGIAERRGVFTCFEALRKLAGRYPQVLLLLIGPVDRADQKRFDGYMSDPLIRSHTRHYPWKDISSLPSYILASDVCLVPFRVSPQYESGVANKVFQYLLFGRPVIVSDCRPQVEVVERAKCGLVFESDNSDQLVECVTRLMDDPQAARDMGERGRKMVTEEFHTEVFKGNLIALYRSLEK